MTTLSLELLRKLQSGTPNEAWAELFSFAWETCSPELSVERLLARSRVVTASSRRQISSSLPRDGTSGRTTTTPFRGQPNGSLSGVATPRQDALSWFSMPCHSVKHRGSCMARQSMAYTVHSAEPTGAELPADTNPFAKALGFGQRSALENNGASGTHKLQGARTDSVDLPWQECVDMVDASTDWVLWHHWPDKRIHDLDSPGHGLSALAKEAADQLTSDDFWALIERLTTGRRLVITGDHGYASTGLFPDTADSKQAQHLKARFRSGRSAPGDDSSSDWVPPIDVVLDTPHGRHAFALGRRKWKSQGGYPTLAHGGLSLLEVAVPFIELSRPAGS